MINFRNIFKREIRKIPKKTQLLVIYLFGEITKIGKLNLN